MSVLLCSISRLSNSVSIFCGGSFTINRGLRLGRTRLANWVAERAVDMANTLGKIYGSR